MFRVNHNEVLSVFPHVVAIVFPHVVAIVFLAKAMFYLT